MVKGQSNWRQYSNKKYRATRWATRRIRKITVRNLVGRPYSPLKAGFRSSKAFIAMGSVDPLAGTTLVVLNGTANRDPRKFDLRHDPAPAGVYSWHASHW